MRGIRHVTPAGDSHAKASARQQANNQHLRSPDLIQVGLLRAWSLSKEDLEKLHKASSAGTWGGGAGTLALSPSGRDVQVTGDSIGACPSKCRPATSHAHCDHGYIRISMSVIVPLFLNYWKLISAESQKWEDLQQIKFHLV